MSVPTYAEGEDQTNYADQHGITKNTLVRSDWGNITYQATKVTDTYVAFDNGEKHTHRQLARSIKSDQLHIIGQRSTR